MDKKYHYEKIMFVATCLMQQKKCPIELDYN
jgi:hypothetical protein